VVFENTSNGLWAFRPSSGGQATVLDVNNAVSTSNGLAGVLADTTGVVLLSNSKLVSNGTGATTANGGRLFTYQNNVIDNNVGADLDPAATTRTLK
jgi:hypothetical protein